MDEKKMTNQIERRKESEPASERLKRGEETFLSVFFGIDKEEARKLRDKTIFETTISNHDYCVRTCKEIKQAIVLLKKYKISYSVIEILKSSYNDGRRLKKDLNIKINKIKKEKQHDSI